MLLVTGPTGSGKTTTLYAAITEINNGQDKIVTIEDPVEYQLPGVLQIPVNEKKGLTFASGLRSILRHDPDKIMVGEIRDPETANIAVQSALTGHLVFTTVHANNVFDVIGRFMHMNVDLYSFVSALNAIVAQRLVRLTCPHCAEPYTPDAELLHESGIADAARATQFMKGKGCRECRGTGYRGRKAIAELLMLNDEMRELIIARAPMRAAQGRGGDATARASCARPRSTPCAAARPRWRRSTVSLLWRERREAAARARRAWRAFENSADPRWTKAATCTRGAVQPLRALRHRAAAGRRHGGGGAGARALPVRARSTASAPAAGRCAVARRRRRAARLRDRREPARAAEGLLPEGRQGAPRVGAAGADGGLQPLRASRIPREGAWLLLAEPAAPASRASRAQGWGSVHNVPRRSRLGAADRARAQPRGRRAAAGAGPEARFAA